MSTPDAKIMADAIRATNLELEEALDALHIPKFAGVTGGAIRIAEEGQIPEESALNFWGGWLADYRKAIGPRKTIEEQAVELAKQTITFLRSEGQTITPEQEAKFTEVFRKDPTILPGPHVGAVHKESEKNPRVRALRELWHRGMRRVGHEHVPAPHHHKSGCPACGAFRDRVDQAITPEEKEAARLLFPDSLPIGATISQMIWQLKLAERSKAESALPPHAKMMADAIHKTARNLSKASPRDFLMPDTLDALCLPQLVEALAGAIRIAELDDIPEKTTLDVWRGWLATYREASEKPKS